MRLLIKDESRVHTDDVLAFVQMVYRQLAAADWKPDKITYEANVTPGCRLKGTWKRNRVTPTLKIEDASR